MNKALLLVGFFVMGLMYPVMAQRDKEFQIRAGFGWSIYDADFKLKNGNSIQENDDGALSIQLPLEFRYELTERWNIGLDMKFGSYVYERDSAEGKSNSFFVFGIAGEYTIVNKDNFRWYSSFGIHAASLVIEEKSDDAIEYKEEEWTYSGGGIRLNTGVIIYLGDVVGLNFNLGLDTHNFKLKEYIKNSKKEDLSNLDATLKLAGLDGTIGLVFRIPRKNQ
ncbi:MAG: outer membrane beta-barrel protein [Bacteroidetes bacterium]|nr:outer membrane beta-barrel protein [Bacteroidota bacterium]